MSISTILYTGQRALSAHQAAIQVAGQNIANVNTPGYSRQRADFVTLQSTFTGDLISGGVDVEQVTRAYDQFVTGQVHTATSRFHSAMEQADLLDQVESIFDDLNSENGGLSQALDDFFNGFQDLANDPESLAVRTTVLQRGETVSNTLQSHASNLQAFGQRLEDTLEYELTQVNTLANRIAELNRRISEGSGPHTIQTNTLRDERDQLVKELSEQVGVSTIEADDGTFTVLFQGGRPLIEGRRTNTLVLQDHPDDPSQSLVYMQDDSGQQTNVTSLVTSGKVSGLLDVKDGFIPQVLQSLDRLAAQLTSSVNQVHSTGFGLDGSTGNAFFVPRQISGQALDVNTGGGVLQSATIVDPAQLPIDDIRIQFVADGPPAQFDIVNDRTGETLVAGQTYTSGAAIVYAGSEVVINDTGTPPLSGDAFIVRTTEGSAQRLAVDPTLRSNARQVAATQTSSTGGNTNALALANLKDEALIDGFTVGGFYTALVTGVGAESQLVSGFAEQQQLLLTEIENRRESISGVSLEEEQIDLIRFQQAFAAAAQLINIADELADTVIGMAG